MLLIIIIAPLGLELIGNYIYDLIPGIKEAGIVCDRDKNIGCNIDFKLPPAEALSYGVTAFNSDNDSLSIVSKLEYIPIAIISGGVLDAYIAPLNHENNFPDTFGKRLLNEVVGKLGKDMVFPRFAKNPLVPSPYTISAGIDNLLFSGRVKDYKTDEILGWFDGNEFGVVERCSFSWNKDDSGVEIVDKYGNICFSLDEIQHGDKSILIFRGYFKLGRDYYIFNNSQFKTDSVEVAERLIKEIKPIFDHTGRGSFGKRI